MDKSQPEQRFVIRFPQADAADANIYARDLADFLKTEIAADKGLRAEPERSNRQAQDFGATLVLILGTAAATAIAKGIQAWLKGHTGARMEIVTDKGKLLVSNVESKSAAEIAKAFTEMKK